MTYFIVNPAAGGGKAKAAVPVIEEAMRAAGNEYSFVYTDKPNDFTRISNIIFSNDKPTIVCGNNDKPTIVCGNGYEQTIVCVGGDGTVQEYAGLAVGKDVNFGVIPAGSGNDLMYSLPDGDRKFNSFKEKITFFTNKIIRNEVAPIDAVNVNDEKYCVNICGTGIDIQVLQDAQPLKKIIGGAAYFVSLIKNVVTYKTGVMGLSADGADYGGKILLLALCNGSYYGGHLKIGPDARMDDGLITMYIISKMPRYRMLTLFPAVGPGGHINFREVSRIECSTVILEFEGKKILNLDGNLYEYESPVTFKLIKNAIRMII